MLDLRLDQIGKTFPPSQRVLDDITLTIPAGQCLAMLGPSGCGKTTLLRIIAGLEAPSAGAVHIGGVNVTELPSHCRQVAMLFQRPALVPTRTVRQNLRWSADLVSPLGFKRLYDAELRRIAELLDLERELDRPVRELSGGQQQRVALGRCLLRRAAVCLLDEPLGHLDAPLRVELRRQIRALTRDQGITLLHVTHDPEEAFAIGDQVAVLHAGRIAQIGPSAALRQKPRNRHVTELVCHARGGLNVVSGVLRHRDGRVIFDCPFGKWPVPDAWAPEFLQSAADLDFPEDGGVDTILGIAAADVCCGDAPRLPSAIRLTLPRLHQEDGWMIAGDARGRWIGRLLDDGQGQEVTMMFSLEQAYWFDANGQTLRAPAG